MATITETFDDISKAGSFALAELQRAEIEYCKPMKISHTTAAPALGPDGKVIEGSWTVTITIDPA